MAAGLQHYEPSTKSNCEIILVAVLITDIGIMITCFVNFHVFYGRRLPGPLARLNHLCIADIIIIMAYCVMASILQAFAVVYLSANNCPAILEGSVKNA
ncbi:hypothetical protein IWZ01DRAFT_536244 [Phyllosticta capitalensis]